MTNAGYNHVLLDLVQFHVPPGCTELCDWDLHSFRPTPVRRTGQRRHKIMVKEPSISDGKNQMPDGEVSDTS